MAEYTERSDNVAHLENTLASEDDDDDDDSQDELPHAAEILPRLLNRGKPKTLDAVMVRLFVCLFVCVLIQILLLGLRKKISPFCRRFPRCSKTSLTSCTVLLWLTSTSTSPPNSQAGRSFASRLHSTSRSATSKSKDTTTTLSSCSSSGSKGVLLRSRHYFKWTPGNDMLK